jgi:hypothetical protein
LFHVKLSPPLTLRPAIPAADAAAITAGIHAAICRRLRLQRHFARRRCARRPGN